MSTTIEPVQIPNRQKTIGELELYEAKINKFSKFQSVRDFKEDAKERLLGTLKDIITQAEDHLTHPGIVMPEPFRKEWEERRDRARKWLDEGIDNLYVEESIAMVPKKPGDILGEKVGIKVHHMISFSEA